LVNGSLSPYRIGWSLSPYRTEPQLTRLSPWRTCGRLPPGVVGFRGCFSSGCGWLSAPLLALQAALGCAQSRADSTLPRRASGLPVDPLLRFGASARRALVVAFASPLQVPPAAGAGRRVAGMRVLSLSEAVELQRLDEQREAGLQWEQAAGQQWSQHQQQQRQPLHLQNRQRQQAETYDMVTLTASAVTASAAQPDVYDIA
jgi:hypothetical protein